LPPDKKTSATVHSHSLQIHQGRRPHVRLKHPLSPPTTSTCIQSPSTPLPPTEHPQKFPRITSPIVSTISASILSKYPAPMNLLPMGPFLSPPLEPPSLPFPPKVQHTPSKLNGPPPSFLPGDPGPGSNVPIPGLNAPNGFNRRTPGLNVPTPGLNAPTPGLNVPPGLNAPTHGLNVPPGLNVPTPGLNASTPGLNVPPGLNAPTPGLNVPIPALNAPTPGLNVPNALNAPSPGLNAPFLGSQRSADQSFMGVVKSILLWDRPFAPSLQDFQFVMSHDTAQHKWSTFESFERSLEQVIASDPNSIMAYGSEFKPPEMATLQEDPGARLGSSARTTRRTFATTSTRRSPTPWKPQVREKRRRRPCNSPHRRRHKRIQFASPLSSSSQHSWPFTTTNGCYHTKYHQRTQRYHLEETPHSRFDIRGPKRYSLPQQPNQNGRPSQLPFRLGPPSNHTPRREPTSTKPDDTDLHTKSRLVQSLPSRSLLGKRGVGMCNSVRRSTAYSSPSHLRRLLKCVRILQLQRDSVRPHKRGPPLRGLGPQRGTFPDSKSDPSDPTKHGLVDPTWRCSTARR
jgi:hypothetical protein